MGPGSCLEIVNGKDLSVTEDEDCVGHDVETEVSEVVGDVLDHSLLR